jgi:hypothetical protein
MRRSLSFAAAAVGLTVVLTGCSDSQTGTAAPASAPPSGTSVSSPSAPSTPGGTASPAAASWVDGYCGSLLGFLDLSNLQQPSVAPGDTAGGKQALLTTFGKVESAVGSAVDGLNKLPAAPVPAGDAAKKGLVDVFTPVLQKIKDLEATLQAAPADDAQSLLTASTGFQDIGADVGKIDDPLKGLTDSPELAPALKTAPNCKKLPQ